MYPGGYTAEVTSLSSKATEKEVQEFFAHCGAIEHVEIIRSGEYTCTAYVTFKDAYALETALLLSGARIADQCVCITRWGSYIDESEPWNNGSWKFEEDTAPSGVHVNQFASSPSEAVTVAQEVVKTMLAKGYDLGKDALVKAKAFDESHKLSATAVNKVTEFSDRIGLTDKLSQGMETVKYVDETFHVSEITKSAAYVTGAAAVTAVNFAGKTAVAAANAAVNSSYFAKGAIWVSGALERAAEAAADFGKKSGKC